MRKGAQKADRRKSRAESHGRRGSMPAAIKGSSTSTAEPTTSEATEPRTNRRCGIAEVPCCLFCWFVGVDLKILVA